MTVAPRRLVDPPEVPAFRHSLLGAVALPPFPDHAENGVEYRPEVFGSAFTTHDPCNPAPGAPALSLPWSAYDHGDLPLVQTTPFTVYQGFRGNPHWGLDELARLAEKALALTETRAVEYAFWTGSEGNRPRLADAAATTLNGGVAVPARRALSLLEDAGGQDYHGDLVVHAPRALGAYWSPYHAADGAAPLRTHLGSRLAYGAGYSAANTGPDGTAAPAGQFWVYATGQVAVWRGPAFTLPTPLTNALEHDLNEVVLYAARTVSVGFEGPHLAVLVNPEA